MFTLCLQTYLHHVYRHVYSMLENMSRHAYTMLEDIFTLCLKSSLHQVLRHVCRIAMSELMFTPSFKTCLQHVWTHTYTKLKNMLTYTLNTYFHTVWRYAYFKTFLSNFINMISPWLKICLHLCLKAWLNQVWKHFLHNKWRHYMTQKNFMLKQIQYDTGNLRFTRWLLRRVLKFESFTRQRS